MDMKTKPKKAERLITRHEDESLLVFDSDSGAVKVLNETAALVWEHIDGNTSVGELVDMVAAENPDADTQAVKQDVIAFLQDLKENTFIQE